MEITEELYDKLNELSMIPYEVRKDNVDRSDYSKHTIEPWNNMEEEYKSFFKYLIEYAKNNNWVKVRKSIDSTTLQLSEYYVLNIPENEQDNLIKFLSSKFSKLDVKDLIKRFVTE